MFGVVLSLGATFGLVGKREWKLQIDDRILQWTDGKRCGQILTERIKKVRVEEGDGRCLIIETDNHVKHIIPGECYGDALELRSWFKKNLGNRIELDTSIK